MSAVESGGQAPADQVAQKAPAEALALRAQPRPIARFRRPVLIAAAAIGAAGVAGFSWLALSPRGGDRLPQQAPVAPGGRAGEDAIAALPKDYSQARAPILGAPLPGDLGRAVLDQQRRDELANSSIAERNDAGEQAAQAEHDRLAAQLRQARESPVMIQTSGRSATATSLASISPAIDLGAMTAAVAPPAAAAASSDQGAKRSFLTASNADDVDNAHQLSLPASPYQVMAGTIISATLLTGLDSDLPGFVTAQVTENVYDTVSGRYLLIPQGARLLGAYDSSVAYGQKRALLVWRRLILPDGASIQLDNLPATDAAGYAGLRDQVDFHTGRLLQGVAMSTLLGVGAELALDDESEVVRALRQSTQQATSAAGQQMVGKQLDVQPTLRVRPGWPLRIIVHKDLTLRPWRTP